MLHDVMIPVIIHTMYTGESLCVECMGMHMCTHISIICSLTGIYISKSKYCCATT